QSLEGLTGAAVRVNGEPTIGQPRLMLAMNSTAAHNYDLIPVERYFALKRQRQFDYIASAGCHFRCAFCADPFVYKRKWAGLSPERMGEELEAHWRRYRFDEISFQDETFFTYRDRVVQIAEEFLRRDLRFSWTATMRADQGSRLSEEDMATCVRAGLTRVMVGVESGSQEMMDWLAKDISVEQVIASAEKCARHGIGVIFPFIVGFPGESDESIAATMAMVKRLRAMSPRFETPIFYFKPYPGSRITDEVVKQGYQLPQTLEEWADFDFVGSSGPWVSAERERLIERFKFYNRFAWGPETLLRRPMQQLARWRCRRDFYAMPVEKAIVERLRPMPRLS
ncbi:MAG: B12-binding domain-containing radical SAM protein, partial [Chloroflexales bacterium]|nr:B12-binding domain-containing radical SAM protein [Chloroflexales bacterium]